MRDEQKLFQLMRDTSSSIYSMVQAEMDPQFDKPFTEQRFYRPTLLAYNVSPNAMTAEMYSKRNPYTNPQKLDTIFADGATAGYLESDGNKGYKITDKGAKTIDAMNGTFYNNINKTNQFPVEKTKKLSAFLSKLVEACIKAEFPNGTICLDITHNGHSNVEAGSLAKIDQQLDDLNAFRDDAHIAAWMPVGVSGHTWEVLSYVWNGKANTVEKLVERLPYRNYSADEYAKTLEDITQKGWVETGNNGYTITEVGKKIREEAEDKTNANYFGPWKILSDDELIRLDELMTSLREINLKIAEENKKD